MDDMNRTGLSLGRVHRVAGGFAVAILLTLSVLAGGSTVAASPVSAATTADAASQICYTPEPPYKNRGLFRFD